jgi:hypothetical protein
MLVVPWLRADARDCRASCDAAGSEAKRDDLMTQKPQSLLRWDIYKAAAKARWIGIVEAIDEREAIEKAAEEFKTEASKLIAAQHP